MDKEEVRYGETYSFTIESDDLTAETATFYIGKEGEQPVITAPADFVGGVAEIEVTAEQTKVPLGEYKYQITIILEGGKVQKYPTNEECSETGLPTFTILEALDEIEVIS